MSDIDQFIRERKGRNPEAWARFEGKYRTYAIGLLLPEHRDKAGLSLEQFPQRVNRAHKRPAKAIPGFRKLAKKGDGFGRRV